MHFELETLCRDFNVKTKSTTVGCNVFGIGLENEGVEDLLCRSIGQATRSAGLQRLDSKPDRAMGHGGTEHRLTSIKCSVLCIQYISNKMCIQLKPLKC